LPKSTFAPAKVVMGLYISVEKNTSHLVDLMVVMGAEEGM
jgi:hypothetical protein